MKPASEPVHKHDFQDRMIEVRHYLTSASVGIFRCACDYLFARPVGGAEAQNAPGGVS